MSGLKDRLRRYVGQGTGSDSPPEVSGLVEQAADLSAGMTETRLDPLEAGFHAENSADSTEAAWNREESLGPEWDKLDAVLVQGDAGAFIRRKHVYPTSYIHGSCILADLYDYAHELRSFTGEGPEELVSAEDLIFFDTETTGLGHGAGNVAFMVGLGYWQDGEFTVEQLFIRNPAEELAMLDYLKKMLERYRYMVSYNGKSFDWPLLQSRFVMHRMRGPEPEPLHLDFLYASRSLWRHTLPSCKLGKVEETQLEFIREDDVPGSMAPALYFLFLAEKKPSAIAPVFTHNEWDILSLAGLAVLFGRALCGGYNCADRVPEEQFRYGLWLARMGCGDLSGATMDRLYQAVMRDGEECRHYRYLANPLAAYYKQSGQWEQAVALWGRAIAEGKAVSSSLGPALVPYIELAMYFEHRQKTYEDALVYAEEALQWAEERHNLKQSAARRASGRSRGGSKKAGVPLEEELMALAGVQEKPDKSGDLVRELRKRTERLQKKLERTAAKPYSAGGKPEEEFNLETS